MELVSEADVNKNTIKMFHYGDDEKVRTWAKGILQQTHPHAPQELVTLELDLLVWLYLRPFISNDTFYYNRLSELKSKRREWMHNNLDICIDYLLEDGSYQQVIDYLTFTMSNLL